jgi:molybdopterin-guanine dinucleotide biosynthesis protein B
MQIPVLSIVGRSKTGKTTPLEKIIPELKRRGYRLATIKRHSHPGFEIDQPGKDTWRHAEAGSDHVIIAAPDKIANIRRLEHELTLDEIIAQISCESLPDMILTEGYKTARKPAIEVVRAALGVELLCSLDQLVAVATDTPLEVPIRQFGLEDSQGIVDFIVAKFLSDREA